MWLLRLSKNPAAPWAMLAALVTFILAVTALTSLSETLIAWRTLPSRGLRWGLRMRGACSAVSLIVIGVALGRTNHKGDSLLFFIPDIWTGLGSLVSISWISDQLGYGNPLSHVLDGGTDLGFLAIYAIAIIDGAILCFIIFILSFVSMLVLQIIDRKALWRATASGSR